MRQKWIPILLFVVFGLSLSTARAMAQGQASAETKLQEMSKQLNLTDDQKAKLKPILEDELQQVRAVQDDSSLTKKQKFAKLKSIRDAHAPQINGVLTPEQQEKLKEMSQEAKGKARSAAPQYYEKRWREFVEMDSACDAFRTIPYKTSTKRPRQSAKWARFA
jgi:Spy/CpxP family protein refolding chaperone